ncbi:MAG: insulinase family protein [Muribaculaceae bacterium]|nr:insulinase family protein [Muribaculaceae bacterium]
MITINRHTFANGLRLLHHYDAATRMVAVNLLYDVGSKDEDPACTGLAHLCEHLMFSGTESVPKYDTELQKAGGDSNAWTNADLTNYYETLPAHNIETALWVESDRLQHLALSEESVATQKNVVIEEFKQRSLNVPYGDLSHILNAASYKVHPYRWPVLGLTTDHIAQVTRQQVKDFFEQHYSVNNLIMCISGNVPFDQAVQLVDKWFGAIPARSIVQRNLPVEPMQRQARFVAKHSDVPQDLLYITYHMCGRRHPDYQACDLLSDVLANGTSSRFFRNVLMKTQVFTDLDAAVTGSIDPGLFLVRGKLRQGCSFDEAQHLVNAELCNLVENGVSQYEITKCTNKFHSHLLFDNIGYADKALRLCEYEHISTAEDFNTVVDKYKALTPEKVQAVAQQIFAPENATTLHYGPSVKE